jgi:hypothetical protein
MYITYMTTTAGEEREEAGGGGGGEIYNYRVYNYFCLSTHAVEAEGLATLIFRSIGPRNRMRKERKISKFVTTTNCQLGSRRGQS